VVTVVAVVRCAPFPSASSSPLETRPRASHCFSSRTWCEGWEADASVVACERNATPSVSPSHTNRLVGISRASDQAKGEDSNGSFEAERSELENVGVEYKRQRGRGGERRSTGDGRQKGGEKRAKREQEKGRSSETK